MNKMFLLAALVTVCITACKKTGNEGQYEVQKPVVGTVTDTVQTPVIAMDSTKVTVPDVDIKKDTATIKVPTIKKP